MSTDISVMDLFEEIDTTFWKIDNKLNKKVKSLLSLTSDNIYNYEEICSLNWKLDDIYNFILASILYIDFDTQDHNDSKNITSIAKYIINFDRKRSKVHEIKAFEKKIGREIKILAKMKLIEVAFKERFGNTGKFIPYYKLSLNGLFYVIINWYVEPFLNVGSKFILDPLLKNYSDCPLLKQFLLKYFEKETLEDPNFDCESDILEYLEDICKGIIVNKKDRPSPYGGLIDGMIPTILFIWPSSESDRLQIYKTIENRVELIKFLSRELGNKWMNGTKIIPDFENDQLQFKNSYFHRNAFIKINRRLRSVELVYNNKKYSTLKMYVQEDKNIAVIGKSEMSERKLLDDHLNNYCKLRLFELICSISMKKKGKSRDLCEPLKTDKKYKVITNELIDLISNP